MLVDIWNKDPDYYEGYESFCFQNCLRLVLQSYGVENAPLYVNASIFLKFDSTNNNDVQLIVDKNNRSLLPDYLDKVTRVYHPLNSDCDQIFKENMEIVEKDKIPLIVGVDIYYLPYLEFYHKGHGIHTAIFCGEDAEKKIGIIDWYEPWFFKGLISKEDFLQARNSQNHKDNYMYSGTPIQNNWTKISKERWNEAPEKQIRDTLLLTLDQFFEPKENEGVLAFKNIISYLEMLMDNSLEYDKEIINKLHKGLFGLSKRYSFFKQYIEIACHAKPELSDLICLLDGFIGTFQSTLLLLYKLSFRNSSHTLETAIAKLNECEVVNSKICSELKRDLRII